VDLLGRSVITATARYPYQAVDDTAKASDPLTKEVRSLFTKYLVIYPKGAGDANSNARIVVAHAQDVDGTPFVNERVCFNVDSKADGVFWYSGQLTPTFSVGGSEAPPKGRNDVCGFTDANGNTAVEILNSDPEVINTIALFDPEGLLRSIDVDFRTAAPLPPVDPKPGALPKVQPKSKVVPPDGPRVTTDKIWIAKASLIKKGKKVYLVVKVRAKYAKKAALKAKVLGKRKRKLGSWTKTVKTNKTIKLKVNARAKTARLSLAD
jgi:hypothetical protein